jgi:two-component system cell cycle sensor histidine kinase/response regulator CckA
MTPETLAEIRDAKAAMPLRVLILQDHEEDTGQILFELARSGFSVTPTVVETIEQFYAALVEKKFDVLLADSRRFLPESSDTLAEIRRAGSDIPFLLIAGPSEEPAAAADFIRQGASGCISKDRLSRLPVALMRMLTEKKLREESARAFEALRESEARTRDFIEHADDGIFHVSGDGGFLDANPALLRIIGCSSAEDLNQLNFGRDLFRFPEGYARLMAECRQRGHANGEDVEWRRRDGGLASVHLRLRQVHAGDRPDAFEVTAQDVTELRAMERQLRQAQKFEAIGQMAGGVAHDFNNVVGAILGWAELGLEQSRETPRVAERFSRIREQAERAAALTRELLAFARRQVMQPVATDLNGVVGGVVSLLDKVIGRDVEFKFKSSPLDPVKADPTRIEQVLTNLCLNSRDAMPEGGRLVIETEMVEIDEPYCRFYAGVMPGRYAVISVTDTGVGMTAETRERIFEPFFTTKERGKGTGMGLATVYGIVKQHGGFIHVYSEPGHGSLFRVYLPVMESLPVGGAAAGRSAPPLVVKPGTETILLADDHESIREMARQTLTGLGYRVLSACDGEEALRLGEHETPALAILDMVMPKLGGPATAAKLAERLTQMRVLFTSGYAAGTPNTPAGVATARYLQKPYSPTALAQLVREILDEPPAQQAVDPSPG